jgi:hypothetical protein
VDRVRSNGRVWNMHARRHDSSCMPGRDETNQSVPVVCSLCISMHAIRMQLVLAVTDMLGGSHYLTPRHTGHRWTHSHSHHTPSIMSTGRCQRRWVQSLLARTQLFYCQMRARRAQERNKFAMHVLWPTWTLVYRPHTCISQERLVAVTGNRICHGVPAESHGPKATGED